MSEEIKNILEEMRFKAGIYIDHKKRDLSFNDEEKNCALLLDYIQQKENIIKEVREKIHDIWFKIDFPNMTSMSYAVIKLDETSQGNELLEILEKENIK